MFVLREVVNKVMDNTNILVSVICLTYNHEKYVKECLDSIVSQRTDFLFEIIVHDDASSDDTQKIIRDYVSEYPDIIKPILQTENQYSKGKSIVKDIMLPKCQGRYVAFCEGDDFWTDELKLQKQYDAIKRRPDCLMCVSTVRDVSEDGTPLESTHPSKKIKSQYFETEDFLKLASQEYAFQTTSYFIEREAYNEFIYNPPEFRKAAFVGDWPVQLYFCTKGSICYINDEMSCYRRNVPGSFTDGKSLSRQIKINQSLVKMIELFDDYTERKYSTYCNAFKNRFLSNDYYMQLKNKNYKTILGKEYSEFFEKESLKNKIYIRVCAYLPCVARLYDKLRKQ